MVRAVRPFWIDVYIDGRSSRLSGGPRAGDGGLSGQIFIRNNGDIETAVSIYATSYGKDGNVILELKREDTGETWRIERDY